MSENNVVTLLQEVLASASLVKMRLTGPRASNAEKHRELPRKVEGRMVRVRGRTMVQFSYFYSDHVTHRNLPPDDAPIHFQDLLLEQFKQAEVWTTNADYTVVLNRKRQPAITRRPAQREAPLAPTHDRQKAHILPEGVPCHFLERLGVMTAEGKIVAAKYDKFRQVNRFLEMVRDVTDALPSGRPVEVVDFGCGRSYLTFALYHYLRVLRGLDARVLGLDLKEDVIAECQQIAADLRYTHLRFEAGDIRSCQSVDRADMVVCLHACDTATDEALARAVHWEAQVILAVPCCHRELRRQIQNDTLRPMLKHGIVRERMAALVTDCLRAQLLEASGYSVQLLEFIEMEHTPKNLLIRAVRRPRAGRSHAAHQAYKQLRDFWHAAPSLEALLQQK